MLAFRLSGPGQAVFAGRMHLDTRVQSRELACPAPTPQLLNSVVLRGFGLQTNEASKMIFPGAGMHQQEN